MTQNNKTKIQLVFIISNRDNLQHMILFKSDCNKCSKWKRLAGGVSV